MGVFSSQKFKRVNIDSITVRGLGLGFISCSVPSRSITSGGCVCHVDGIYLYMCVRVPSVGEPRTSVPW